MNALTRLDRLLSGLERGMLVAAGGLMLAMMSIVVSDVVLRYAFHRPLSWAYDVISLYLMGGAFFLSLSSAYASQHQVGVDLLVRRFGPDGRRVFEIVTCLVALPLFLALAWVGGVRAVSAVLNGDAMVGPIAWPTWISASAVPIGAGVLILRLLLRLAGHAASLASGRDIIAPPPIVGAGHGE